MKPAWCALLVAVVACSDRDHSNPFDPDNPQTGGHPLLLWAIPAARYVRLHWSIPDATDLLAPCLLRYGPSQPGDTLLRGAPFVGTYVDGEPSSGTLRYVIEAGVDGWNGAHRSDTSIVLQSPGDCWIASGYDRLSLLSARTTSLLPTVAPGTFIVDVSAAGSRMWAAGMPRGVLYGIEASAAGPYLTEHVTTSLAVRSVAASQITNRVLIAHSQGLSWFDPDRATLTEWPLGGVCQPVVVRAAPDEAGAWVWLESGAIAFLPPGAESLAAVGVLDNLCGISPTCDRQCWIGARSGLYWADGGGIAQVLNDPVAAVTSTSPQRCWACLEDGTLIVASRDGGLVGSLGVRGYLACASAEDRVVWVASRDTTLWKLSEELRPLARLRLFELPWAVQPGPRSYQ